jgi:tRNA-2-methylthio-N6-dimethylallyladenosine synthase
MKCYLETFGCQMNLSDSELVRGSLESHGFIMVDAPEEADILLMNTCSIRQHAEDRALGRLSDLYRYKKYGHGKVLGVLGCLAQHYGNRLAHLSTGVDLVMGPDSYRNLPDVLLRLTRGRLDLYRNTRLDREEMYDGIRPCRKRGVSAWVQVMRGCDRFCAYCIVPYVRGRERSRSIREITAEVSVVARSGISEVILLGQNVNAYRDGEVDFPGLLRRTARIPGIRRLRFITSHPKNFTVAMIDAMASSETICNAIHLPLQSGSDRVLRLMNRGYTVTDYIRLIDRLREEIPSVAVSTDLMVGFPGEREEDYRSTLNAVCEIGFDSAYMFKYSSRKGTKAADFSDPVPPGLATERLARLIEIQKEITAHKNRKLIGSVLPVLVEGAARRGDGFLIARTDGGKMVVFRGNGESVGTFLSVRIIDSTGATLIGRPAETGKRDAAPRGV